MFMESTFFDLWSGIDTLLIFYLLFLLILLLLLNLIIGALSTTLLLRPIVTTDRWNSLERNIMFIYIIKRMIFFNCIKLWDNFFMTQNFILIFFLFRLFLILSLSFFLVTLRIVIKQIWLYLSKLRELILLILLLRLITIYWLLSI